MNELAVTSDSRGDGSASVTRSRTCDGCGDLFVPGRSDARYCSGRCRQQKYRQRHAQPRRRRPITDAWRDATTELRRAADRVQRLIRDDRFADNLPRLYATGARNMLAASFAISEFETAIKALPRTVRTAPFVTAPSTGDGSAEVAG